MLQPSVGARLVEIGTLHGQFAKYLLRAFRPSELVVFDNFGFAVRSCETSTRATAAPLNATLRCIGGSSQRKIPTELTDGAHDLVYVDGEHEYLGVCDDLEAARTKVRVGGLLVMNDYHFLEFKWLAQTGRWGVYGVMHVSGAATRAIVTIHIVCALPARTHARGSGVYSMRERSPPTHCRPPTSFC